MSRPSRLPASRGRATKVWQSSRDEEEPVVTVRNNRPIVKGFATIGGAADAKKSSEGDLHPQEVKMARKSGKLNLSNRGFEEVPKKVFHLYEMDPNEAKVNTLSMSMDNSSDDRWWETVNLTKLFLNSNCIMDIPSDIGILSTLQILDLSDNRLKTLPVELGDLKELQKLTLSHNNLTDIPDAAMNLPDLRFLKVDHNDLTSLPDLTELTLLTELDASHNKLTTLPDSIHHLKKCSKITASNNKLKELNASIGDLYSLVELDVSYNEISKLPSSLNNLAKLTSLYIAHNRLTELPSDILIPSLRDIHLANNCIKEISSDQLKGLVGLRVLDIKENKLDVLPDEITLLQMLERLDLSNNTLSTVPCHLGLLTHLRSMPLEGNPLRQIRRDIVQRGTQQLLKHLRDKVTSAPSTYPGFGEDSEHPDGGSFAEHESKESNLPDKWQMKNSRQVVYSEKAATIPDELLETANEAQVPNVDFSGNTLTELPKKLSLLAPHVKELVVSCNRLTSLPTYLGEFSHLVFLDIHANRLECLPDEIGNLKFLRELNMTHNRFTKLPECLRDASCLEIVFAGDNRIEELDISLIASWPRIATLQLSNNNIGVLPPALGNVTQIRSLQVEGNPFRVPRNAIIVKGTNEIMSYLRGRIVPDQ